MCLLFAFNTVCVRF